jgi:AraC-like DNA-binding protein
MGFLITKPSISLSQYVRKYWALENCLSPETIYTHRIIPSGLAELFFYFNNKPTTIDISRNIEENIFISGHQKDFYDIVLSKQYSLFSILFNPLGLTVFFDIPVYEFYNKNVPLKYSLKNEVNELESKLLETKTFFDKIKLVEDFLLKRLGKNKKKCEFHRLSHSISLITKAKGNLDINYLASEACLSRKQYERIFSEYIGTSPKQFLRTIRFQNTLVQKSKDKNDSLTSLAYNCGYYDQSHMISEFKLFSGMTPTQYFSECEPFSDYFQ